MSISLIKVLKIIINPKNVNIPKIKINLYESFLNYWLSF